MAYSETYYTRCLQKSFAEMQQSLDLDPLKDRRKVHRLDIFHLAVNKKLSIQLCIN